MYNAAIDIPDERDYSYEELLWSWILGDKIEFPKDKLKVYNQSIERIMRMSCTRVGLWHIINAQNLIQNWTATLDYKEFWERHLEIEPSAESNWASLQGALDQAVKEWLIGWYFKCTTISWMHDALDRWYFIYTWSANWDWSFVRSNNEYRTRTDDKFVWHAFCLSGKEELLNSYWEKDWYSKIDKSFYNSLYTKYAILPVEEYNLVDNYKKEIMSKINIPLAKVGFELWVWNWLDADKPITREEAVTVILRALEKFDEKKINSTIINTLLNELK